MWRSPPIAREVRRLEAEGTRSALGTRDLILSSRTQERMYLGGDTDAGIVSLGPAAGFADAIEPAGKIVERLVEGACAALGGDDRAGGTGVGLSP
ncbi:hypothetical protein [Cupriavidus metallidurans]|uniref:hypothetical protein n=1 Tax=Cupriavidus metallidurans TaxID=119219 RepID=UPI0030785C9E